MTTNVVNRLNIKYFIVFLLAGILFFAHKISAATLTQAEQDQFEQTYKEEVNRKAEQVYQQTLIQRAASLVGKKGGECLIFARRFSGMGRDKGTGMAKNIRTNSSTPQVGAVVKTKESRYGHVAVVLQVTDTQIQVVDSNYKWNHRIGIHWMNLNSSKIAGYVIL